MFCICCLSVCLLIPTRLRESRRVETTTGIQARENVGFLEIVLGFGFGGLCPSPAQREREGEGRKSGNAVGTDGGRAGGFSSSLGTVVWVV